jgi:hypothetical protein
MFLLFCATYSIDMAKEIDDKYYENVAIKHSHNYDEVLRALDIVKKFILREQRIVVGGMSIDFALKAKGEKGIYGEDVLPDFDFYSHQHHVDAYEIAQWLYRVGFTNISVINALHPSTMKVRVNFVCVADITYIPKNVLEAMPVLRYRGFQIIHPHVQMIDQHRALCYPYENTPWETIMGSRPKKDMKRHDLLYNAYPLRMLDLKDTSLELKSGEIHKDVIVNQCITGFLALIYWINIAKSMGYVQSKNFGMYEVSKASIIYKIPQDSHGVSLYSDNIKEMYGLIKKIYKPNETRFYSRFLDKLPRKIILDNTWELLENQNMIAAHVAIGPISNICGDQKTHVSNLQNIMMYLLVNYILLMRIKRIKRGYSFYAGYLECRKLLSWAIDKYYDKKTTDADRKLVEMLLPTHEIYGQQNLSESYLVSRHNFDIKNKDISEGEKNKYRQPMHLYDRDLARTKTVPRIFYNFDTSISEVFDFDGGECKAFI